MFEVGIGTYSMASLEDMILGTMTLEEKLKRAAELGYRKIELLAADLECDTQELLAWAKKYDLTYTSVHAKPTEENVRKMAELGGTAVIWPMTDFNCRAEAIEAAQELDALADMAEPFGIKVGYHNHNQEFYFDEGKTLLEHLMDNSSKCFSQLDCGWAQAGGMYPPYFIRKYRNRIISIHVKENSKVIGPGKQSRSRHDTTPQPGLPNFAVMTDKERQAALEKVKQTMSDMDMKTNIQCRMGADESNIDWLEIRKALNEQDFEAFWVVERESFYADRYECLKDDCDWLKGHIR